MGDAFYWQADYLHQHFSVHQRMQRRPQAPATDIVYITMFVCWPRLESVQSLTCDAVVAAAD